MKTLTFVERNVELAQRWRAQDETQRKQYINRAKNDAQILHEETRLKREMKKIESNVSVLKGNLFIKNTF